MNYKKDQYWIKNVKPLNKTTKNQLKNIMNIFDKKKMRKVEWENDNEVDQLVEKVVRDLGLNKFIWIKKRTRGLTGNSQFRDCHWNVGKLVKRYGGKRVTGYSVQQDTGKGYVRFYFHSVWLTPENELVDVTRTILGNENYNGKMMFSITGIDRSDHSMYGRDFSIINLQETKKDVLGNYWSIDDLNLHVDTCNDEDKKFLKQEQRLGHKYGVLFNTSYEYLTEEQKTTELNTYRYDLFKDMVGLWVHEDSKEFMDELKNITDEDRGGFWYEDGRSWSCERNT